MFDFAYVIFFLSLLRKGQAVPKIWDPFISSVVVVFSALYSVYHADGHACRVSFLWAASAQIQGIWNGLEVHYILWTEYKIFFIINHISKESKYPSQIHDSKQFLGKWITDQVSFLYIIWFSAKGNTNISDWYCKKKNIFDSTIIARGLRKNNKSPSWLFILQIGAAYFVLYVHEGNSSVINDAVTRTKGDNQAYKEYFNYHWYAECWKWRAKEE